MGNIGGFEVHLPGDFEYFTHGVLRESCSQMLRLGMGFNLQCDRHTCIHHSAPHQETVTRVSVPWTPCRGPPSSQAGAFQALTLKANGSGSIGLISHLKAMCSSRNYCKNSGRKKEILYTWRVESARWIEILWDNYG